MSEKPEEILEDLVNDLASELINSDTQVNSTFAITNTSGFDVDGYDIDFAEYSDDEAEIDYKIEMRLSGEQDKERPFCGSKVRVTVSGKLKKKEGQWKIADYEEEGCGLTDF